MKKFMFIGAILAGVAVWVLLAPQEVFTMSKGGEKRMTITVDTATGNFVDVVDEKGNRGRRMTPAEVRKIYESEVGFKYVVQILHTHSSPGCWVYLIAGEYVQICIPQQP